MDRTCAVDGCEITNRLRRGLCNSHYKAWLLYGDPTVRRSNKGVSPEKRYWQKVDKTETCWLWTGAKSSTGYGHIQVDGKTVLAHRFGFELANGPIAPGAVLDHTVQGPSLCEPGAS